MKEFTRFIVISLTACLLIFLSGCATPSKSFVPGQVGEGDQPPLPTDANQTDSLNAIPQQRPPDNVDPDKDIDYQTLAAQTVYFQFDSSAIQPSERPKLDAIAKWMQANPGKHLMIAGHTDLTGTPEYNRGLGERRASAVRAYLVGLGVPSAATYTISYGMDRPASNGHSEADGAKNRRAIPGILLK